MKYSLKAEASRRKDSAPRREAGFSVLPELEKPWVLGYLPLDDRKVPVVATRLGPADRWGSIKARWGMGRMRYSVLPGLYAAGKPDRDSPVFVSANYKMSFDALRAGLEGLDAWILVLDTKGINVWCAAGKGSFGTEELARRLSSSRLSRLIDHRRLILPQLGAPGVSAPEIARRTGFRILWGPVRAADIGDWLRAGQAKSETMRRVSFRLRERMAVAPIELVHAWPILPAALVLGALAGLPADDGFWGRALPRAALLAFSMPLGTLAFPALLPWIPGRPFVLKGALLGAAWALAAGMGLGLAVPEILSALLLVTPVTAFIAMNFTGASTFTSQPGALWEVEKSFWPLLGSLVAGLGSWAALGFLGA